MLRFTAAHGPDLPPSIGEPGLGLRTVVRRPGVRDRSGPRAGGPGVHVVPAAPADGPGSTRATPPRRGCASGSG
ncbi:hypothetical protein [Nocardioides convexus]|uniref:hypothetical protein n=1 Tax=Nocardioides convexus TaxID=2712224 RepID=UPI00241844A1|nr:hypothetical protein [Nocardioides convexus]